MVAIRIPATSANLGPGFDVLGLALPLYNRISLAEADGLGIVHSGPYADGLPTDADHLSLRAARGLAEAIGRPLPTWRWEISVHIPPSRGLGSSSAAIVGGLVAANEAFGRPLDGAALLELAARLEGHPDNVAPALVGGVTAAFMEGGATTCIPLAGRVPATLVAAVPDFKLSTAEARAALPAAIPRADAIANIAHVTALTTVMLTGEVSWLPLGLRDRLHQPYRLPLIPGAQSVFDAATGAGAWGAVISGAGPTLLALAPAASAAEVGRAMAAAWAAHGVAAAIHVFDRLAAGAGPEPA